MPGMPLTNDTEKIFRRDYLFSREDLIKSIIMFIENMRLNEFPKLSPIALNNQIKLCEKFLKTIEKCRLPVLTELWNFYEYRFLVDRITLELCDGSDFEIEDDEIHTMKVSVEHELLNIECDFLSVERFAEMHNVDSKTVEKWIHRGKLRYAKKVGDEWLIPNTQDKPGRWFQSVEYLIKPDEQINCNEFPTVSAAVRRPWATGIACPKVAGYNGQWQQI
jgi:excisionase family DNA binding protein